MEKITETNKISMNEWDSVMEYMNSLEDKKPETDIEQERSLFYIANCKTCGSKIKMSSKYTGNYPLCYLHRNPNDRINSNKKKLK